MDVVLTLRDIALLRLVAAFRVVPLDLLAERFFTTELNEDMERAPSAVCRRRLRRLAQARYVQLGVEHDGRAHRTVARPGARAACVVGGEPARRRIPARNRVHHIRTLEAIRAVEREVHARGGNVIEARLEHQLRGLEQRGRRVRPGDKLPSCPDAVVVADLTFGGKLTRVEIAVEYVTSKYTDANIVAKHESFARFHDVFWFADRPHTAERVRRLTGASCAVLP
ncbi:MAG: hypothetical protein IT383_00490 [Deltaproteobacteria bacterium]|nr:hypothetical protein [Deltaproteobacteria bacterium]